MEGLSPLISVVLLIAISVIVASLIMSWSSALTSGQQIVISNRSEEITECAGQDAKIEDVYLDFTTNKSRVTVRNSGQVDGKIVSASLQNLQGVQAQLNNTLPLIIKKGELKTLEFLINGTVNACANFSQVRITTLCTTDFYRKKATNC